METDATEPPDSSQPSSPEKPPKKPFSETWLGDLFQKTFLLVIGFCLTVLVAEHIKRSYAIQDLRIAGYKSRLDEQKDIAEKISKTISDIGIGVAVWRTKLQGSLATPKFEDVRLEYTLDTLKSGHNLLVYANEYVQTFCAGEAKAGSHCWQVLSDATNQVADMGEELTQAANNKKFDAMKSVDEEQATLITKISDLESFMFVEIRNTRKQYQEEISNQPWW